MKRRVGVLMEGKAAWYDPKPDITARELALLSELMWKAAMDGVPVKELQDTFDALPSGVKRHFEVGE